jgi:hypothetical protein
VLIREDAGVERPSRVGQNRWEGFPQEQRVIREPARREVTPGGRGAGADLRMGLEDERQETTVLTPRQEDAASEQD